MSNSKLVVYTNISPNKTVMKSKKNDTITIHCMAAPLSIEACGKLFADPKRQASSNYGIGPDGRIGLYVDEKDRSWCSSNSANDGRAITIEVACEAKAPYKVTDKAYNALIKLLVDICQRNKIKKLLWKGDKSLIGQVDKQNMTVHRWFKNKACPGDYLYNKHSQIAKDVNAKLTAATKTDTTKKTTGPTFKVGSTYSLLAEMKVRKGPGTKYAAKKYSELTTEGKKKDKDKDGALNKGSKVKVLEVKNEGKNIWVRTADGWIAAYIGSKAYMK